MEISDEQRSGPVQDKLKPDHIERMLKFMLYFRVTMQTFTCPLPLYSFFKSITFMRTIPFFATIFFGLFLAFDGCCQATAREYQPDRPSKFSDRVFFGGNLGLQFGDITLVDVSPLVGYRITEKVAAGVSFTYKYYHFKSFFYNQFTNSFSGLTSNIYGASIFGRYYFVENIFAHAEYEYLNYTYDDFRLNPTGTSYEKSQRTVGVPGLFLGGGYRQPVGGKVYFSIMILYNIMESQYSPYSNPIIRGGISVGL
jgi:hypothetical protein